MTGTDVARFTHKSVPVIFEPPCIYSTFNDRSRYSASIQAGRSGGRIPVESRFSAPFPTGRGAHLASYTVGTGSFPGIKRLGRDTDYLPHLAPRLKKE